MLSDDGGGPLVRLIDATEHPFDLAIASARTCYSSKGIIYPEEVSATAQAASLRDRIAQSTLQAGHLTTRQHPHFVFAIDRVSRHVIWSFLHSHPFYNSEQVSQRYVEVKPDRFHVPPSLGRSKRLADTYHRAVTASTAAYFALMPSLEVAAAQQFYRVFPARRRQPDRWRSTIHKKAMETARYILPVATHSYLYHTINGLTLHRYRRMVHACDVPGELHALVDAMWQAVRARDPLYADEMLDPVPLEETAEYRFFQGFYETGRETGKGENGNGSADIRGIRVLSPGSEWMGPSGGAQRQMSRSFVAEFDEGLGGRVSRLCGANPHVAANLGAAVRAVLGLPVSALSDGEAWRLVLDPARNPHLASTLNESTLSPLSRTLVHAHFTFQKRISHTADSQDQRHRTVPASRPVLMRQFTGAVDAVVPGLMDASSEATGIYREALDSLFRTVVDFLDAGATEEEAVYLLPNAFPVRFYESGDLLNLHHKWKARTCYTAQEEIFRASVEELEQVGALIPGLVDYLRAPCYLRNISGARPFCPEGDRFCGVPVWNQGLSEYRRVL